MYSIEPGEDWGKSIIFAATQTDKYEPLYARVQEDSVISRWRFSARERELIAAGEDLFLVCKTFGNPLQPVSLWIEGNLDGNDIQAG